MFVFTLQIAMPTVTMEILRSFVKHHFLIVVVPILNQIIKKKTIYSGKKLRDFSVVFILTKLIAVYLYKASMPFFEGWFVGRVTPCRAKTNKAALPKLLEDGVDSLQHLPAQTSAVIMDAMTIL